MSKQGKVYRTRVWGGIIELTLEGELVKITKTPFKEDRDSTHDLWAWSGDNIRFRGNLFRPLKG